LQPQAPSLSQPSKLPQDHLNLAFKIRKVAHDGCPNLLYIHSKDIFKAFPVICYHIS